MKPLRMCMVCRDMKPKQELIRIVKPKEYPPSVDHTFKAQGRGAYICRGGGCALQAEKRKVFERAFKTAIDRKLYETLRQLEDEPLGCEGNE